MQSLSAGHDARSAEPPDPPLFGIVSSLGLEHLEHHCEAQSCGAGLVAEQRAIGRMQRPTIIGILTCLVDHSSRLR